MAAKRESESGSGSESGDNGRIGRAGSEVMLITGSAW